MNVAFLCVFSILLVVASASPSDTRQHNDEVKELKDLITKLTRKVNANSIKLDPITQLTEKVNANTKKLDSYTEYCSIMATGTCGSCICKDDRRLLKKYYCDCSEMEPRRDCLEFYHQGARIDGVYKIHPGRGKTFQTYCDHTTDGGGWTVFQRRNGDASVDFYRSWIEYRNGFGDLQHEFWLGNQNLSMLSLIGVCISGGSELRVDLESVSGSRTYAKYSHLEIGTEYNKYPLTVGGYSGDASDALSNQNKMMFSTYDRDNDKWPSNCASTYKSGWWYNACSTAHLNGRYLFYGDKTTDNTGDGIEWYDQKKFTEMKIRRKPGRNSEPQFINRVACKVYVH